MDMDCEPTTISGRALILLLAIAAALRSGNPNMHAIASIDADIGQLLAFRAEVVVRLRIMGEAINGVEPIILARRTVAPRSADARGICDLAG